MSKIGDIIMGLKYRHIERYENEYDNIHGIKSFDSSSLS